MVVYVFDIDMTCGGCSGAVKKVLAKTYPEEAINCEWESKQLFLTVEDDASENQETIDFVLQALSKWSTA